VARKYFGTDGVRGKVGELPITPEFVMRLGYAAGQVLLRRSKFGKGERPAVLIGKDTRISGYMLEAALEAGLSAAGIDVMLSGPMPTPAIAYLTRALRLQAGIVISASHNPYPDNGIKFFSAAGNKLPDVIEQEIEAEMGNPMQCRPSAQLGRARRIDDAAGRYIEFCKSTFPSNLDLRGLKIVVDCAHGAAYHIAPHVIHELGAEVITIGVKPDGFNINDMVGATSPQALQAEVKRVKADLGIALDGDADRLLMVDGDGSLFDGDQLIYAVAKHRSAKGGLEGVVGTLMSNLALEQGIKKLGAGFARAKVGDRYVLEMLREKGWELGGENSGHMICLDKHTTGDGIVAALQVLTALRESKSTLQKLAGALRLFPQVLINVRLKGKFDWQANAPVKKAKAAAEAALGNSGRVLLRPSGTEPLLRVMVEGRDKSKVEGLAKSIAAVVTKEASGR
jgi:phosphoglucosamine mutase